MMLSNEGVVVIPDGETVLERTRLIMIRTTSRIAVSLLVPVALSVSATSLQGQEAMAEHCTASFSHESVAVQAEPVMLLATFSQEIGDIEKGMSPEESGIVVKEVKTGEKGIALYLDTRKAVAGEWKIGFKGTEGACGGVVKIEAGKEMKDVKEKQEKAVKEKEEATKEEQEKQEKKAPESGEG